VQAEFLKIVNLENCGDAVILNSYGGQAEYFYFKQTQGRCDFVFQNRLQAEFLKIVNWVSSKKIFKSCKFHFLEKVKKGHIEEVNAQLRSSLF
jgi:hypothetical protein